MGSQAHSKFVVETDNMFDECENFAKMDAEDLTESLVEAKLESLEEDWKTIRISYETIYSTADSIISTEFKELARTRFRECREKYQLTKANMNDLLKAARNPPTSQSGPHHSSVLGSSLYYPTNATFDLSELGMRVPACDIKVFNGSYEEWPSFRDMFSVLYHTNPRVSQVEKFFHLLNKTSGDALSIVQKFPLSERNYLPAWNALNSRYENKKFLVEIQLKSLFNIKVAVTETSDDINRIRTTICDCLAMLTAHGIRIDQWDPILVYLCSTKLPIQTIAAWEESLESETELPTWDQMDKFLRNRHRVIERVEMARDQLVEGSTSKRVQGQGTSKVNKGKSFTQGTNSNNRNLCHLCHEEHNLRICQKFFDFSVRQRTEYVEKNKICTNCLSPNHLNQDCKSVFRCTQCKERHHSLLHPISNNNQTKRANQSGKRPVDTFHTESTKPMSNSTPEDYRIETPCFSGNTIPTNVQTHMSVNHDDILLPTALIQINHLGEKFTVRALIDSASKKSFMTERIRKMLNLRTEPADFEICGLGGTVVANSKQLCNITLCADKHSFMLDTQAVIVSNLTSLMPSTTIANPNLSELSDLELADPKFFVSSQIDMLLGSDVIPYILLEGTRKHVLGNMVAQNSVYGWFIYGPLTISSLSLVTKEVDKNRETSELCAQLRKFWEIEEISNKYILSEEDTFCEELYKKTTYRREDGRYVVKLPFKQEFQKSLFLSSSRFAASRQYIQIESSLRKNGEFFNIYNDILQEYLDLGHMERCDSIEKCVDGKYSSYYLPHHAVFRPESASTKVRIVFNGSRKTKNSYSLNDMLYNGPILQRDLMTIILNWRKYKYVFNGDIEKMYRQIVVDSSDRSYQRILFRNDPLGEIMDYELTTVTFGINCAPYLAIRTLLQLANDTETDYPLSSKILRNETYVDDILSGGHDLGSALEAQQQLCKILSSAGFPLKKITANHPQLLENIPKENLLDNDFLRFIDSSSTKTLGIHWNAMTDCFSYKIEPLNELNKVTKRQILSCVAKLFDPAGWLTPIIIESKMLLQELWQDGVDWDDEVKQHIFVKWRKFTENLQRIEDIKIPRWVKFQPENDIQLHGFCDASELAYCAAIYIRSSNSIVRCSNLLIAKSKVAPLQKITLPRLELCGAVLLSKLVKHLLDSNLFPGASVHLWSDSTIVLAWLQKHPSTWKTYVANRTTKILENVGNATWRHVLSAENPADLGTRGCTPQDLMDNALWWHGPMWLLNAQEHWPISTHSLEAPPEERRRIFTSHCITTTSSNGQSTIKHLLANDSCPPSKFQIARIKQEVGDEFLIINSFTKYHRALRVISYIYRFYHLTSKRFRSNVPTYTDSLSQSELNHSKIVLIKLTQKAYYAGEYKDLSESRPISRKSSILTLNPFLDSNGLIRVNGRLVNSAMTYDEKCPIIIPYESNLCEMILGFMHSNLMHADISLMMNMVRYQFYIPALKRAVKKCINKCLICVRYKQRSLSQIMAALPPERTTFSLPFTFTGVDFAGPFQIKAGHLRNSPYMKGYAAIFVCFATRSIHLEPCSSLLSEAFLATFDRFVGRRGLPRRLMSDNGTNFVGASKTLLEEYATFLKSSSKDISEKYAIHGFEWKFIPPSAPHMGGLWEAGVKSFKLHFKKVVGNHKFNFEEFSTLLARIEGVLNSRPLSPMSEDPGDLNVLTPGHFLRGAPIMAPPEMPMDEHNLSILNRWEKLKALHHRFAQRWKVDYLHELHKRYKWRYPKKELSVGDFVIVKDEILPPNDWRMGRIEAVYHGLDKRVRVADVRTQFGLITRPIVKLCWLPVLDK